MKKAIVALALLGAATQANATIVGGKHDLNLQLSTARTAAAIADGQTCVYCHTPHQAVSQQGAPLWNRTMTAVATYVKYDSTLLTGAMTATIGINSQTCLSCHDGTIDLGVVLNGADRTTATVYAQQFGAIYNIGTNLQNDHPVAVAYPAVANNDFNDRAAINGTGAGQIRLYGATGTVECGTCHDPHVSATAQSFFLRVSATNSAICILCHKR